MPKKPAVKVLREEISRRLGIKTRRIYEKAQELAISVQTKTEDGIYLLAARSGINLNRYLPREKVQEIRTLLVQSSQQGPTAQPIRLASKTKVGKVISVTVGKTFTLSDPLLNAKQLAEAKEMAEEVYPLLYVFENSVREIILRIMQSAHGVNWWDTKVPADIRREVEKRKAKEEQNAWHGKRGAHEIYYTDLEHLARIGQNNWIDFQAVLPSPQWLKQRIDEIAHSRNPAAHMNPLKGNDISRIKVYFRDWQNVIMAKKSQIPS